MNNILKHNKDLYLILQQLNKLKCELLNDSSYYCNINTMDTELAKLSKSIQLLGDVYYGYEGISFTTKYRENTK